MLLSACKTMVEAVVERVLDPAVFLIAVKEVVDRIERKDFRLVAESDCVIACDGSSIYLTTSASPVTTTAAIQSIFYDRGVGVPVKLIRKADVMPPPNTETQDKVLYYDFLGASIVQLNTYPADGTLIFRVRTSAALEGLTTLTYASVNVPYPALPTGVMAWLGQNLWQDARAEGWEKSFQSSLSGMFEAAVLQESDLRNLGDRSTGDVRK